MKLVIKPGFEDYQVICPITRRVVNLRFIEEELYPHYLKSYPEYFTYEGRSVNIPMTVKYVKFPKIKED